MIIITVMMIVMVSRIIVRSIRSLGRSRAR